MGKLKKGKYKLLGVKKIKSESLYSAYKKSQEVFVEKYHKHDGNPLLFYNTPIYIFAKDYVDNGKKFLRRLDSSAFVLCSMERYNHYVEKYKTDLAKRIMKIVDSIRKHGYSTGKYKGKLIGVVQRKTDGYVLISGKHRAAACLALGIKKLKCNLYRNVKE